MIKIIIAVVFLCGAIFLGPRLADSQGFVHIATNNYIIETSLTTATVLGVIAFLILHVLVNILFGSFKLPKITFRWFGANREKSRLKLQSKAFLAYEEGNFNKSLGYLNKIGTEHLPTHCLFLAAKSAFELDDLEGCRKFLDLAEEREDSSDLSCKLLRAQLNLKLDNTEAALENLSSLENDSHSNAMITRLLCECYERDGNYEKLSELLPTLKTQKVFEQETFERIAQRCLEYKLSSTQSESNVLSLVDNLSRSEKKNAAFMVPVVKQLVKLGSLEQADKYAVTLVKEDDGDSKDLYNTISQWPKASSTLLQALEHKSVELGESVKKNVPFLQALANLELQSEKFNEAKGHVETALAVQSNKDGYMLAAELSKRTNNEDDANRYMQLALKCC